MKTEIGTVEVKLDRITITGWLKCDLEELEKIMNELHWEMESDRKVDEPMYRLTRYISDDVTETVAVLVKNQFHNSWRLDTSNHLKDRKEKEAIQRIIMMMKNAHTTRIDIAFDFINCKYSGMKHVISKPNVTTADYERVKYRGRGGGIETIYAGKRRSLAMYRYYDKYTEQLRARKKIPKDIKNWERLEIQLRGDKTEKWIAEAENMLYYFKLPQVSQLPVNDQVNLLMLTEHPEVFKLFGDEKKAKYRKMYRENQGMNTEYAKSAVEVLKKNVESINREIKEFLLEVE